MKIPPGRYSLIVDKKIYKTGEEQKTGRDFVHWMSFTDGTEFNLETEEHRLVAVKFDMEIEVDVENKVLRFGGPLQIPVHPEIEEMDSEKENQSGV